MFSNGLYSSDARFVSMDAFSSDTRVIFLFVYDDESRSSGSSSDVRARYAYILDIKYNAIWDIVL